MSISRALISVSDKTGLDELARGLHRHGVEILSTGGTAKFIASLDIPVIEVSDFTGSMAESRRSTQKCTVASFTVATFPRIASRLLSTASSPLTWSS